MNSFSSLVCSVGVIFFSFVRYARVNRYCRTIVVRSFRGGVVRVDPIYRLIHRVIICVQSLTVVRKLSDLVVVISGSVPGGGFFVFMSFFGFNVLHCIRRVGSTGVLLGGRVGVVVSPFRATRRVVLQALGGLVWFFVSRIRLASRYIFLTGVLCWV